MNRQAHFEAILARARARPNLVVHDTDAPLNDDGTVLRGQYVVLHDLGADHVGDERYTKLQTADSARVMRVVGRCAGEDVAAVRRIASVLEGQLAGWTPVVAGRTCWPMVLDNVGEIQEDDTVKPPMQYVDLDFTYRSNPGG